MDRKLSRRAMLLGARGLAISLPFLASWRGESGFGVLSKARADGPTAPKRIVFWLGYWGALHDQWTPREGFALNKIMEPLAPFRDKLTVLSGVNMASIYSQIGRQGSHSHGGANMLTSAGYDITYPWGPGTEYYRARGASIDQVIAERLDSPTKFKSIYCGDGSDHIHTVVQDTKGNDLQPTYWPHQLFDRMFGDFTGDATARERIRLGRGSVLDSVRPSYEHLVARISAADKRAVEQHLDAIRDLERRVKSVSACVAPTRPGEPKLVGDTAVSQKPEGPYEDFVDLMAAAMTCDLSRVFTFGAAGRHAQVRHVVKDFAAINPPNAEGDAHSYSHAKWDEPQNQAVWREFQTFRMRVLARFAQKLSETTDVDGRSVLDNTCIAHVSEISTGLHDIMPLQEWGYSNPAESPPPGSRPKGLPILLLGGLGGEIKTGRHLDLSSGDTYATALGKYSHGELYLTLARMMGVGPTVLPTFGNPEVCKRTIDELRG